MKNKKWLCALVALWFALSLSTAEQQPARRPDAVAELVLLDVVVRDRRGNPVRDLRADEIEVYEDGVRQQVRSFRFVEGERLLEQEPGPRPEPVLREGKAPPVDSSRQINLVTLVFERLGNEGRQLSRQAALDFLNGAMRPNQLVAVFRLDQRLHIVQPFTTDSQLLRQAIDRCTLGAYSEFRSRSDAIRQQLETAAASAETAQGQAAGVGRDSPAPAGMGGSFAQAQTAEILVNILRFSEELERQQQGQSSIFGLLALVREQRRLAGRKTLIYFSEGLHVPPGLVEIYRATISEANRANVSVYAVDARGLTTTAQMGSSREMLEQAAATSRAQMQSRGGRAVTRADVMVGESAEASLRMNLQGTLNDLSESTGGFLTANTNDFRSGMRRVSEDIGSYYEVSYVPKSSVDDGEFREISVKILRNDLTAQTRSGYFALPPSEGPAVMPYEVPMLAAFRSNPLARDLDFRFQMLRFDPVDDEIQYSLVMEIPLAGFDFSSEDKLYNARFSLLALVKDAEGRVVRKFSQDYPLQGPRDRLESLKRSHISFTRPLRLAPGRYSVETVVFDQQASKGSARRVALLVPGAAERIRLSSLFLIGRADKLAAGSGEQTQPDSNPLHFGDLRIIPDLLGSINRGAEAKLSLYLGVYPAGPQPEPPRLAVFFLRDGQVVARATPELPAADAQGRIAYVGNLPLKEFHPGQYEIRALVQQGQSAAEERAFFTVR